MQIKVNDGLECRPGDQLGLPFYDKTIDVDGMQDPKFGGHVRYIGRATHVFDNIYRCLAQVDNSLCVVEITVSTATSAARG